MVSPTPVSALIHAATMVAAGIYFVARLLPVFAESGAALVVLAVMAAVTMIGSGLAALAQDDIKRVLAYSTIGQLGYMAWLPWPSATAGPPSSTSSPTVRSRPSSSSRPASSSTPPGPTRWPPCPAWAA